jgi:hypothetical protein
MATLASTAELEATQWRAGARPLAHSAGAGGGCFCQFCRAKPRTCGDALVPNGIHCSSGSMSRPANVLRETG